SLAKVSGERIVREALRGGLRLAAALRPALIRGAPVAVLFGAPAAGARRWAGAARAADLCLAAALGGERDAFAHQIDLQHAHAQLIADFDDLVRIFDEAISQLRD